MTQARDFADSFSSVSSGRRNLIINGAMQVAQRGTSATGLTTGGYRTVDRHYIQITSAGTWTVTQSTDTPTGEGFSKSLKYECTTANASLGAASSIRIQNKIEGQNLQSLAYGTSSAKSITVSFWVKSSKTGTYVFDLQNTDNSRISCGTYTISSANTWEKKTITLAGDTSQGFDDDNNGSLTVSWWLAAGSNFTTGTQATVWEAQDNTNRAVALTVNLADTIGNTFYITGVQLELGNAASPFEHRSYGEEIILCYRYYQQISASDRIPVTVAQASNVFSKNLLLFSPMRTQPSLSTSGAYSFDEYYVSGRTQTSAGITRNSGNEQIVVAVFPNWSGMTDSNRGNPGVVYNAITKIDAEL